MALEMRAAPRPVSARRPPRTAARAPWAMVAADRLLAAYWTVGGQRNGPDPSSDRAEDGGFRRFGDGGFSRKLNTERSPDSSVDRSVSTALSGAEVQSITVAVALAFPRS
jgi:hypothetical protein